MEAQPRKKRKKHFVFLITYAILLVFVLFNISKVSGFLGYLWGVLAPLIYGIVFAFLINMLVNLIKKLNNYWIKSKKVNKYLSIALGYLIVLAIIVGTIFLMAPEVTRSMRDIASKIPQFITTTQNFISDFATRFDLDGELLTNINRTLTGGLNEAFIFLSNQLPVIIGYTFNFVAFIVNLLFGLVISLYILLSKDHLIQQCKKAITVIVPEKYALKTMETMTYANEIFRGYVGSQLLLSLIIGVMTYVGSLIFGMPYALLNSVIIMVTNMIPIVGPIIGAIPTTLIILMVDPMKGIGFLIMVIVIQQFESNFIAPKISGDSVGMSGLWTLVAIVVGGGLFGVVGMIVAVPVMAVIYHLASDFINNNYDSKYDDFVNRTSRIKFQEDIEKQYPNEEDEIFQEKKPR